MIYGNTVEAVLARRRCRVAVHQYRVLLPDVAYQAVQRRRSHPVLNRVPWVSFVTSSLSFRAWLRERIST